MFPFTPNRHTIKFDENLKKLKIDEETWDWLIPYGGNLEKYNIIYLCISSYFNGEVMLFNRKLLRYTKFFSTPAGYVTNGGDIDTIAAGTCSKF